MQTVSTLKTFEVDDDANTTDVILSIESGKEKLCEHQVERPIMQKTRKSLV